jgi:hypothetical protein
LLTYSSIDEIIQPEHNTSVQKNAAWLIDKISAGVNKRFEDVEKAERR